MDEAASIIRGLTKDLEAGEIYYGTVTRMLAFGAFVECIAGKEGLLHVSEVSTHRIPKPDDVFKVGDRVLIMVKEIDDMGRVNLTRKRLFDLEPKVREAGFGEAFDAEKAREEEIVKIPSPAPGERPGGGGERRGGDRRPGSDGPRRRPSGDGGRDRQR